MATTEDVTRAQIEHEKLGVPGIEGVIYTVPIIKGDPRLSEDRLADTKPRVFEVKGQFGKFAPFPTTIAASIEDGQGESYVSIPTEWDQLRIDTPGGPYTLYANAQNELATVSATVTAASPRDAFELFLRYITPIIDSLSFRADVPLPIVRLYSYDAKNQVHATSFVTPYRQMLVKGPHGQIWLDLIPVYALYREAKAGASSFYRFLCYFKIIEGVFGHVRPKLMGRAKSQGIPIDTRKELVPPHPELGTPFDAYVGKAVKDLFDRELTNDYRDAVAHFGLNSGTLLNPSDHAWSARFADALLVAELCARVVVETEEYYCQQFYSRGGR